MSSVDCLFAPPILELTKETITLLEEYPPIVPVNEKTCEVT